MSELEDYIRAELAAAYAAALTEAEDKLLGELERFQPTGLVQDAAGVRLDDQPVWTCRRGVWSQR